MQKFHAFLLIMFTALTSLSAQESLQLDPGLSVFGLIGNSSAEDIASFAPGGHDPNRKDRPVLQSLEPSLSLRWGEQVQGFVSGVGFTDEEGDLDWEWEEAFVKLTHLPGGLELRGGRFLNRIGFHNPTHLHAWDTVDAPLPHALFLGEDGLATQGGELNFWLDRRHPTLLSLSFGQRPSHSHDHGHGDDHDDHGEDHEDDSGHGELGEPESFRPADDVWTFGLRRQQILDDFHHLHLAAFGGVGDNEMGKTSWFSGAGVEVAWRENGLQAGGRALRWRTELIYFHAKAGEHDHGHEEEHEEEHEESHEEEHESDGSTSGSSWGFNTQVVYEAHARAHPFARIDTIAASDELSLPEWVRYTAGVTFPLMSEPQLFLRLQGNADERGDESEQAIWLQLGFDWGGPEVR